MDNNDNTFVSVDPSNINDKAFIDNYIIDTSSKIAGKVYKIRISAYNSAGSTTSTNVAFILASVPSKPVKPTFESDGKSVFITMYQPSDGGSVVVNYEL